MAAEKGRLQYHNFGLLQNKSFIYNNSLFYCHLFGVKCVLQVKGQQKAGALQK